jgi:T4 RnlA family RNA ligase
MSFSFGSNLYVKLNDLVKKNNAFYCKDFVLDEKTYRIFSYRLAKYENFLEQGSLECRGHMFDITTESESKLVSLPMEKFFNINENPFTTNLNLNNIESVYEKADGSLISTFLHNGDVRLKSKASLSSIHCIEAMKWLSLLENQDLYNEIKKYVLNDCTVNMEWCSPEQRIVIGYSKPMLKILNIRCNKTGSYVSIDNGVMVSYMVSKMKFNNIDETIQFVNNIKNMQDDIEGFVICLKNDSENLRVKVKTDKYLNLHYELSNLKNTRTLYNYIVDEQIDDIVSKFHEDILLMKQINELQTKIDDFYNNCISSVETFHNDNKHLQRKDFYSKANKEIDHLFLNLLMRKYSELDLDYKEFMKKEYKKIIEKLNIVETETEND